MLLETCQLFWSLCKTAQDALLWSLQATFIADSDGVESVDSDDEKWSHRVNWFISGRAALLTMELFSLFINYTVTQESTKLSVRCSSMPTLVFEDAGSQLRPLAADAQDLSGLGSTNFAWAGPFRFI